MNKLPAQAGVYQIAILGEPSPEERQALSSTLKDMVEDFALEIGRDVTLLDATNSASRDTGAATAAAYFADGEGRDVEIAAELIRASIPVIPTVAHTKSFDIVPEALKPANGMKRRHDDPGMKALAAALLECVGLLRRQRRVFVSYRRTEARSAAVQLHDLLSARGFDVFLDTHSIRPGDPFQDVLWHRLVDSDVMVMLDTPNYFNSRWTRMEIGRARAKDIQVLRVIWPAHTPSRMTDLSETVYLDASDLSSADGPITDAVADDIVLRVERLRSRSLASRYIAITGKLRADVAKFGGAVTAVGAHRAISIQLLDDQQVWAYPVVGVPTAETFNDIAEKARQAEQNGAPILVYDDIGIHDAWGKHLLWLDEQIKSVRAIKVTNAGWTLAAWEGT